MDIKTFDADVKVGDEAADLAGIKMKLSEGEFVSVLSDKRVDRDGEVVHANKLTLPDHMPIDADHESLVRGTVGSGRPFLSKRGQQLMVHGKWHISEHNPLATLTRSLVNDGHIRKMSIRFGNAKRETRDGVDHVVGGELFNAGFVAIPSNDGATVEGSKNVQLDAGLMTTNEVRKLYSADPLQISDDDMKQMLLELLPKIFVGLADTDVRAELAKALGIGTDVKAADENDTDNDSPPNDPSTAAIEAAKAAAQDRQGIEAVAQAARARLAIAGLT